MTPTERLATLRTIREHIADAQVAMLPIIDPPGRGPAYTTAAERSLENQLDNAWDEATEAIFTHVLTNEQDFGLVDDGTIDTVLQCAKCSEWLRFDGRESAIDFLENDRECWLCPESEEAHHETSNGDGP